MAFKQLDLLLGLVQTDQNAPVPDATMLGTGENGYPAFRQVADGFSLDINQEMHAMAFATGLFDQDRSVPGSIGADAKVTVYLSANGTTAEDSFSDFLACAGLRQEGVGGGNGTFSTRIYSPSSDYINHWKRMTLWKYTGEKLSISSYLTKGYGFMFDGAIKGELGKPVSLELTGKGAVAVLPDVADYPGGNFTQLSDVNPPALNGANFSIMADSAGTYKLLSFELDFGNKLELIKDMTKPFGFARCDITEIKAKWKAKVYEAPYAGEGGSNPYTLLNTPTPFDFSISLFSSNKIKIYTGDANAGAAQLTAAPKAGNENGVNTWDLEGIVLHNDWALAVNAV